MTKLNIINCTNEECGKEFKPRKMTSKYCSVKCVTETRKSDLNRICFNKNCQFECCEIL